MRMIWKIIKYSFLGFVIFVVGKITIHELFDNRPIKFEKYKTGPEFEKAMIKMFPNGIDVREVMGILTASNAKCFFETREDTIYQHIHNRAKYIVTCRYQADFISLKPLLEYVAVMQADKDYKIVLIHGMRHNDAFVI